eukprot:COSAG01_NODE_2484_length_7600_cov_2.596587_9_plen_96_part_00
MAAAACDTGIPVSQADSNHTLLYARHPFWQPRDMLSAAAWSFTYYWVTAHFVADVLPSTTFLHADFCDIVSVSGSLRDDFTHTVKEIQWWHCPKT